MLDSFYRMTLLLFRISVFYKPQQGIAMYICIRDAFHYVSKKCSAQVVNRF